MIKKLRTKIIIICFVSVCLVFLIGLAVLLILGFDRINDERVARLNTVLEMSDWKAVSADDIPGIVLAEYDVDGERTEWSLIGTGVTLSEEEAERAVTRVAARYLESGSYGVKIVYSKRVENGVLRVALYDRFYNSSKDVKYVVYSLIALFVGSVCYLALSMILANFALRPIETTWKRQKQFVADASHELKTPLAVIRANTDLIAAHGNATVKSQMQWLENTRFETERMTELVNDLLFLAKNDEGLREELDLVDMSECVESVALAQEVLFYEGNKKFSYEIAPHLTIFGSDGQLKQLTTILLDNAFKYSVGEGNITLKLLGVQNLYGRFAELRVGNDCNEITDEQLDHLFDRFYTVDQSRDKKHTGNGLGLSIANAICENHGGTITANYADGRINFVAQIPLGRPHGKKQKKRV